MRVLDEWTVPSLLAWVAAGAGGERCNALIDVGALVTGLTNFEVAAALLALGLPHCEGCAFVGVSGKRLVLLRPVLRPEASAGDSALPAASPPRPPRTLAELRALPAFTALISAPLLAPLEHCGLPLCRLAAFFDQVRALLSVELKFRGHLALI